LHGNKGISIMSNVKTFKGGKSKAIAGIKRIDERLVAFTETLLTAGSEKGEFTLDLDQAAKLVTELNQAAADDALLAQLQPADPVSESTPPVADDEPEVQLTKAQQAALDDEFDSGCAANPAPVTPAVTEPVAEAEPEAPAAPDEAPAAEAPAPADAAADAAVDALFAGLTGGLGMFAQLAGKAKPDDKTPAQPRPASRSTYTIEKDRPEQNGIKRPSSGGMCRAVWDAMDAHREVTGAVPAAKDVRTIAADNSWNLNNAMIEFYQWRKFNGIFGRAAKPEASVVTVAPLPTCDDLPALDLPEGFVPSESTPAAAPTESDLPVLDL
jgi:hypothetical protein